jgi:hypothetical protein
MLSAMVGVASVVKNKLICESFLIEPTSPLKLVRTRYIIIGKVKLTAIVKAINKLPNRLSLNREITRCSAWECCANHVFMRPPEA